MKEDFLHFIWKHRLFKNNCLLTTGNEPVEIISSGQYNTDAGPDFLNAKIKIDGTLWAGNVEVHRRASDWARHIHHEDKSYDTVILHVVTVDDVPVRRSTGQEIPTLLLQYDEGLEKEYEAWQSSTDWVACCRQIHLADNFRIRHFLNRLAVERLEQKNSQIKAVLEHSGGNWYKAFYYLLFKAFGFSINSIPFELLAKSIPFKVIEQQRKSLLHTEALLFGQAGFLNEESNDSYIISLQKEYDFLRNKFSLTPIESQTWKFLRLRPANFPSIRLAQLSQLLQVPGHLSDYLLSVKELSLLIKQFDVQASSYWDTHFFPGKPTSGSPKKLGLPSIHIIIINMVIPFLFAYGKCFGNDENCERALNWLEELPPEDNRILRGWSALGIKPNNAFYSQALLQLKTMYCDKKRCLHCAIGNALLTTSQSSSHQSDV
jgi:hypothetical protein